MPFKGKFQVFFLFLFKNMPRIKRSLKRLKGKGKIPSRFLVPLDTAVQSADARVFSRTRKQLSKINKRQKKKS